MIITQNDFIKGRDFMNYENEKKQLKKGIVALGVVALIGVGSIGGLMYGWQQYKVFSAEQDGRAALAKAENNDARNIAVTLLNKAEVKEYVDSEIERFRNILADGYGKALWNHISKFEPGEPDEECYFSGRITLH